MTNSIYFIVIVFIFIVVLFIAYSDWGRFPQDQGVVEGANAADSFSKKRFPETSGSGLAPVLPQELPPLKSAPASNFDSSKKQYETQQDFVRERSRQQQLESDERARRNRPRD